MLKGHDSFAFKMFNYVRRGKGSITLIRRMKVEMSRKVKDYAVEDYEYAS
jgi:hypothetical protein